MKTTIIFFILAISNAFCQKQSIHGFVLDSATNQPISFVSIAEINTKNGTVSNKNGEFNITLNGISNEVKITCIGYKTIFQKLSNLKPNTIFLQYDEKLLSEIIVIPDSSLKEILKKSYNKIPENYSPKAIELVGFYRETLKSDNNSFSYFGESYIKIQHRGYQHIKEDVNIEVIKSRITNFPNRDSIDNAKYYNGPFIANWNDPVKMKRAFLNPSFFNIKYIYNLESIITYNNKTDSLYVISFKSKEKSGKIKGKIWIDKKTFAYIKIEVEDDIIKTPNPFIGVKFLSRKYQTVYSNENGLYFLKYTSMTGRNYNSKTRKESIPTVEFLTTNYQIGDDIVAIPFNKRMEKYTVFSEIENNFDSNFWDLYTTIEKDSYLKNQIELFYKTDEIKEINNPSRIQSKNSAMQIAPDNNKLSNVRKLIQKISIGYGINIMKYSPIKVNNLSLIYNNTNSYNLQNSVKYPPILNIITTYIDFELNKNSTIAINGVRNLRRENYVKSINLAYNYYFLLKKIGNPLLFTTSLGISTQKTGYYLGTIHANEPFIIDKESLGNDSRVYLGESVLNGLVGLGFEYRKKRYRYFIETQYYTKISSKEKLFFKTRNNFLSLKEAAISSLSNEIILNPIRAYNGIKPIVTNFGIKVGF